MSRLTRAQRQAILRSLAQRVDGRPVARWFLALTWDITERQLARIEKAAQSRVLGEWRL